MNIRISMLAVMLIAAPLSALANEGTVDPDIKAAVKSMQDGWNRKNGDEFASRFTKDADYVVVNGSHIKGREQIAAGHQQIFDTIYKISRLELTIEATRLIKQDVALVHLGTYLSFRNGETSLTKKGRVTLVLIRKIDRWEITAFQNTQIPTSEGGR